jgi:hypothetical protein
MRKKLITGFNLLVYSFAIVGFVLVTGYTAVRLKLTNVSGSVDAKNQSFQKNYAKVSQVKGTESEKETKSDLTIANISEEIEKLSKLKTLREQNYCKLKLLGEYFPLNAKKILESADKTRSDSIVTKMIMAADLRLKGNPAYLDASGQCDNISKASVDYSDLKKKYESASGQNAFIWANTSEWQAIMEATLKDKGPIYKVSEETQIEPRLIVASMIVEQLRLFNSEREMFKRFFEPLKILCSSNKISLGVMGIKEETARQIENNLRNSESPYYLGREYENKLDFEGGNSDSSRYDRLSSEKNHYYSYLYGALYLKQMMKQWKDAGFDIDYRPEIIGTLFNVGFPQSKPNANPKVGGSHISIGSEEYSFGALSYEFYYSGEMIEDFPYVVK